MHNIHAGRRNRRSPGIFANHDAGNQEKVASFLTRPIGSVTRLSVF
jgi:hypothetical protein